MRFSSLDSATKHDAIRRAKGPVAVIIAEDGVELASTLNHHKSKGFKTLLLLAPSALQTSEEIGSDVIRIDFPTMQPGATVTVVNAIARALPERTWLYYGYNAEYLFYPFAETRSIGEMLTFHTEERRSAMLTYVVDIYAGDLGINDDAVSLDDAFMDRSGYYALARNTPKDGPKERQLNFYGGLRWRFEEHVVDSKRKIDRIALVRTRPDIELRPDHTWSDEELNTYACPWHNNLTAAVMSFRAAKALRSNAASRFEINTVSLAQFGPVRMEFTTASGSGANRTGAMVLSTDNSQIDRLPLKPANSTRNTNPKTPYPNTIKRISPCAMAPTSEAETEAIISERAQIPTDRPATSSTEMWTGCRRSTKAAIALRSGAA